MRAKMLLRHYDATSRHFETEGSTSLPLEWQLFSFQLDISRLKEAHHILENDNYFPFQSYFEIVGLTSQKER